MKKFKSELLILSIILFTLSISLKLGYDYAHPKYTPYKISDTTKEEQKIIKEFYNGDKISKGKLFDIKYFKFNSIDDSFIEILKKTKAEIPDLLITVYDRKTDEEIGWVNMPVDHSGFMAMSYDENETPSYYFQTKMLWQFKTEPHDSIKPLEKDRDLSKLKLVITYRNGKEIHYVDAISTIENQ